MVANIGGSLTPLGDPPLFLGFLQGVSFFWTTKAMLMPLIIVSIILLIVFFFLDTFYYNKEKENQPESEGEKLVIVFNLSGKANSLKNSKIILMNVVQKHL